MRWHIIFLLFLLASLEVNAAFGLKTKPECDSDPRIMRRTQLMECYHTAAVTMAYLGDYDQASGICNDIWSLGSAGADDDQKIKADVETNGCFLDVAKITGEVGLCDNINNHRGDFSTMLSGEASTRDLCIDLATKTHNRLGADFFRSNTSVCAIIYILPVILVGAIRGRGKTQH